MWRNKAAGPRLYARESESHAYRRGIHWVISAVVGIPGR